MLVYKINDFLDYLPGNSRTFYISRLTLDGDDKDMDMVLLLREPDYKFAFFRGKTHRVCQVEFDDDESEPPFVKVWITDPFKGYEDHGSATVLALRPASTNRAAIGSSMSMICSTNPGSINCLIDPGLPASNTIQYIHRHHRQALERWGKK